MGARRLATYGCILSLTMGCGESDGGAGDTAGTTSGVAGSGVSLVDFPTAYGQAYCSWLYRCCPSEQLAHLAEAPIAFTGNTEQECRTNMSALLTLLVPSFSEAQTAGRLIYDPVLAESCVVQLETSCPASDELCQRIAEPLVAPGGACGQDAHCIDSWCIGENDEVDGTCGPLVELGGACQSDGDCFSDQCSGEVCVEKAAVGVSCVVDTSCLSNYCDFATSQCGEAPYGDVCEL